MINLKKNEAKINKYRLNREYYLNELKRMGFKNIEKKSIKQQNQLISYIFKIII